MKVRKTTTLWIISYILVLVLPIIINFIAYITVEDIMLSQIMRNNQYIVEGKMQIIDSLLEGILDISSSCINDSGIKEFAKINAPITAGERWKMSEYVRKWRAAEITLDIDSVFVYLRQSDLVLGTNYINTPRLFFIADYGSDYNYDQWYNMLCDKNSSGFNMLSLGDTERLLYIFSLEDSDYTVVVEVDSKKLQRFLTEIDGDFYIFDDCNNVIVSTGNEKTFQAVKNADWSSYSQYKNIKADGKRLIATLEKSAKSQWSYIYTVDRNKYMQSIIVSRIVNYAGIIFSVLLGMVLIFVSVRKNHKPLKQIVEELQNGSKRGHDELDDYRYISKLINKTMSERNEMNTTMSFLKKSLRDSVLSKLLKGLDIGKDTKTLIDTFDICLPHEYFLAGVIYIEDESEIFFEKGGDNEEKLRQAQFVVSNVLEELLNQYFTAYVFKCDELLYFIINCKDYNRDAEEKIYGCINEAYDFSRKNFNFGFVSALSDCVAGMENISLAYEKANEVLEYKFIIDDEKILTPRDISENCSSNYYYPIQREQNIINAVKNGDYDGALNVLDDVLDKNFVQGNMSGQLARCFIFDILCTIIKSVQEINKEEDSQYLESLNVYSRITECETIAAMRDELKLVLKEICGNISKKSNHIIEEVITCIEENYSDKSLSVSLIAEKCGTTPNYLSLVFKQNTSVGLLEYISKYRIDKAKEILNNDKHMGMDELADIVGYSNVRTFSRVFRKYEGITPAKYRQNV